MTNHNYWIGVVSRLHVEIGVKGRFVQLAPMKKSLRVFIMVVALSVGATIANAQQVPDPRVADIIVQLASTAARADDSEN